MNPEEIAAKASKPENATAIKVAAAAILALMGGVVRTITHGKSPSFVRYFLGGIVGMFSGIVLGLLCLHLELGQWLTLAVTAIGGYTGDPILEVLSKKLLSKGKDEP